MGENILNRIPDTPPLPPTKGEKYGSVPGRTDCFLCLSLSQGHCTICGLGLLIGLEQQIKVARANSNKYTIYHSFTIRVRTIQFAQHVCSSYIWKPLWTTTGKQSSPLCRTCLVSDYFLVHLSSKLLLATNGYA